MDPGERGLAPPSSPSSTRATACDGHLDQACALALAAYDVGSQYDSERVRQAVHDFRASLGTRAAQRITAELDERLHSAYTGRAN